jgi:cytidyltransferase-like protein
MREDFTIVVVTGGFDPLHSGHIDYINAAKKLGDMLIVGLNSDDWLKAKKGRSFMPWHERAAVLTNIKAVSEVLAIDDSDGSGRDAINQLLKRYPGHDVVFANGGDRTDKNIPEMDIVDPHVTFVFGVGGFDKKNSSSWILEEWRAPKTERPWGYYRVIHSVPGCKVKELTVNPGASLSMQRHKHRSEYWLVTEGSAVVLSMTNSGYHFPPKTLDLHQETHIPQGEWHQLTNPFEQPCRIVEIQYGEQCEEFDIERDQRIR